MGCVDEHRDKLHKPGDFLKLFFDKKVIGGEHEELYNNMDLWVQALKIAKIKKHMLKSFEEMREKFCTIYGQKVGRTKKEQNNFAMFTFSVIDGLMIRKMAGMVDLDINSQCRILNRLEETNR